MRLRRSRSCSTTRSAPPLSWAGVRCCSSCRRARGDHSSCVGIRSAVARHRGRRRARRHARRGARCRRARGAVRRRGRSCARPPRARRCSRVPRRSPRRRSSVLTDGQATSWGEPLAVGDIPLHAYMPAAPAPANHAVVAVRAIPRDGRRAARCARACSPPIPRRIASRSRGARSRAESPRATRRSCCARSRPSAAGTPARWSSSPTSCAPMTFATSRCGSAPRPRSRSIRSRARSRTARWTRSCRADARASETTSRWRRRTRPRSCPRCSIAPSDPIKLGAANRALERLGVPWRFGAAQHGESVVRAVDSTRALEGVTIEPSLHAHALHRNGTNGHDRHRRRLLRGSSRARATCSSPRRSRRRRRRSRSTHRSSPGSTTCSRSG